ncbi:MAG: ABC transporter substrate-binding protein [Chloroflexota bacterium]|jgi:branched-chain amino acid transport system substrate-binding protein
MKRIRCTVAAVSALAVLLLMIGCSSSAPAAEPTKAANGASAPAPAATTATGSEAGASSKPIEVKVGLITPLSGDTKTYGESVKNAVELAIEEANKAGKVNITLVTADSKGDATEGVNAFTKLSAQDQIKTIIGPVISRVAIAVSESAQADKVLMITPTGTSPKVTVDGGKRKDYVFRACFIDPFQGNVMSKFALNTLKAKSAAIVYDISNDYSKGLAETFQAAFESGGGQVTNMESYAKDDVDFSAVMTKIAQSNPDVLFLPDYYNKVNLLAKQAREKGIKSQLLGVDGWDSADLDVKVTEGGYFSNHYSPEDQRSEVQEWIKKYQAKYNSVPDALATLGYDGANLLIEAITKAGSDDSTKVRDAMAAIKDYKAVTGNLSFDENGNPIKSGVVIQIKDGKQQYVETVNP